MARFPGIIAFLACWALAAVFVAAGFLKVMHPPEFAVDIMNYRLVPWPVAVGLAVYLPWVEILTGVGLLLRRFRAGALLLAGGMLAAFLWALASASVRGLDIDCGCFRAGEGDLGFAFVRNSVLLAAVCFLILKERMAGHD